LTREAEDFASLDIGLYPLPNDLWATTKSGLKAIQYLTAGVPYAASPVGVVAEIGLSGITHFLAATSAEWEIALESLLRSPVLRSEMGAAGRRHAESHHTIEHAADALAGALREAIGD
jgi:glycosyltransferase involved in cell wall biosynthesis